MLCVNSGRCQLTREKQPARYALPCVTLRSVADRCRQGPDPTMLHRYRVNESVKVLRYFELGSMQLYNDQLHYRGPPWMPGAASHTVVSGAT
jgi:hypothetical protein